jgi:ferric-dicitrate binding protein FerR (iron transport regulator)
MNMEISDELIEKFFSNQCNAAEAEFVTNYLQDNPEELKKYADKKEWDDMEVKQRLPLTFTEEIWDEINAQTKPKTNVIWLKRLAVAACILGMIFLSYRWMHQDNREPAKVASVKNKTIDSLISQKVVFNNTGKEMSVALMDGSVVRLENNSELRYYEPFQNNKRDIELSGKAFFKVAKDKTKPFTVTAGGLSTTALGTSFWVEENKRLHKINVKLLTGKVVIAKVPGMGIKNFKTVYLTPGQELKFETINEKFLVQSFDLKEDEAEGKKNNFRGKNKLDVHSNEDMIFRNTPLIEVFKALEKNYKVSISFNKEDYSKATFTGNYKITDSIDDILKTIGLLNGLEIDRSDSGFIIRR